MDDKVCVNCLNKKPVNQTNNRLVTESCGHVKCIDCLTLETSGCKVCLEESRKQNQKSETEIGIPLEKSASLVNELSDTDIKNDKPEITHISIKTDTNGRYYECEVCKKKFQSRSHVSYHAYCNGQQKPYQCSYPKCNQSFISHSHYKYHMRVHRGEKGYTCADCGESFYTRSKLQRHTLKHTNEKKHSCSLCSKSFDNATALRKHGLTHSLEKPYACDACPLRFRDLSNYKKHRYRHETLTESASGVVVASQRRKFACSRCPQAFSTGKDLRRHQAVHVDSKPFCCKVCSHRFRRKDNLERHIRSKHPATTPSTAVDTDLTALRKIADISNPKPTTVVKDNEEKKKLEILNPLPPLSEEVMKEHMNTDKKNKDIDKHKDDITDISYIREANTARESVIVPAPIENTYVHKIRKANIMAKSLSLPPVELKKVACLEELNSKPENFDIGPLPKNVEPFKKILSGEERQRQREKEENESFHFKVPASPDIGPSIDMQLYKKILYDKEGGKKEKSERQKTSPEMYWKKMKLICNE